MTVAPKVALHRDKTRFVIAGRMWRSTWIPIEELPEWIAFYRRLRDRHGTPADPKTGAPAKPGRYHDHYAPAVDALEALQRRIKEATP
jgi:hypothetical protein